MSYATPLKDLCNDLLHAKNNLYFTITLWCEKYDLPRPLAKILHNTIPDLYTGNFLKEEGKPRRLLQYMGTDVCRKYDPDIWVKLLKREMGGGDYAVDDFRFPNEKVGITIYILGGEAGDNHPSENSIQPCDCDYVLENNGTIADLKLEVQDIMEQEKNYED